MKTKCTATNEIIINSSKQKVGQENLVSVFKNEGIEVV